VLVDGTAFLAFLKEQEDTAVMTESGKRAAANHAEQAKKRE
jgi:hypothetical protein